jgi:uroporphyrinogen decarboxylase
MAPQLLQVFDSWAGELTPRDFAQFSLPYLSQIAKSVKASLGDAAVPMTVFAKGANHALPALASSGYDVVGLDWTVSPSVARELTQGKVALQGNADPSILYAEPEAIKREVQAMFEGKDGFGVEGGHIANLGHGTFGWVQRMAC